MDFVREMMEFAETKRRQAEYEASLAECFYGYLAGVYEGDLRFSINIISDRHGVGGQSPKIDFTGTFKDALEAAKQNYRKINHCAEVDGSFFVELIDSQNHRWALPNDMVRRALGLRR